MKWTRAGKPEWNVGSCNSCVECRGLLCCCQMTLPLGKGRDMEAINSHIGVYTGLLYG